MSSATLLLSSGLLLLALVHCGVHSLSEGQRCNIHVPDQCDSGLACVEYGADAYCQTTDRDPCNTEECPDVWCRPNLQYTPEGQCCPVCPPLPTVHTPPLPAGCTVDGVHRSEGERWDPDSCTSCQCLDGQPLCSAVSCQPLACTNTVYLPGQCCPICLQMTVVHPAPLSTKCIADDQQDGERWKPVNSGPCVWAYCDQGEVLRYSHQCDVPQCANPVYDPDVCCPICPGVETSESVVEEHAATAPAPTSECELQNGVTLQDGESHCPAPNVTAFCNAGVVEISHHCPPLNCENVIRGESDCDCPMCVEDALHFKVGGRLHMGLLQFARSASRTDSMLKQLARDSGLFPQHNDFDYCDGMMCLKMNVLSTDMNATEADVVAAVKKELETKPHPGLEIGYVRDFFLTEKRSARSAADAPESSKLSLSSSSSSSSDRHNSVVPTAVAVSAAVLGVVGAVVGVALLASFVRRRNTVRNTITV